MSQKRDMGHAGWRHRELRSQCQICVSSTAERVWTTMKSKWLKRLLIAVACFVVGVGLLIVYSWIFGGRVRQTARNAKGTVTAEVVASGFAAATDVDYLGVTLKTRFDPIRHTVFGGSDYGAHIQISWIGTNVLLIRCQYCEKLQGGNILEQKWHQVTICYDQSDAIDLPGEQSAACLGEPASVTSESHP